MKLTIRLFFVYCICCFGVYSYGQVLNPSSVTTDGRIEVIAQDSLNIYLGGLFFNAGKKAAGIAQVDFNGNSVPDFPALTATWYDIISDGKGGWYAGGQLLLEGMSNFIHINSDHSIDSTFLPNPDGTVFSLFLDGDILYMSGGFTIVSGQNRNYVAAFNVVTKELLPFNPSPNQPPSSIYKSGNLFYMSGGFTEVSNMECYYFATVDSETSELIHSISPYGYVYSYGEDNANIYLAGNFNGPNGYHTGNSAVLQIDNDIPEFQHPFLYGYIYESIPDGNGGWYVGGLFTHNGINNLIHILPDKTIDPSFNPNPNNSVNALYLDGDKLYVGGEFWEVGGVPRNGFASLNIASGTINDWDPTAGVNSVHLNVMTRIGDILYVGGSFITIGEVERNHIASFNLNSGELTSWNPDLTGFAVNDFDVSDDALIIAGNFGFVGPDQRLNLASVSLETGAVSAWNPSTNSVVKAIKVDGNNVYIGGEFTQVNGIERKYIAQIDLLTGSLNSWNLGADNIVKTISKSENAIYAGGDFTEIGGIPRNYIAAFNLDGTLSSWDPKASHKVYKIKVFGSSVFVSGEFLFMKSEVRSRLMAISKSTGLITDWDPNADQDVVAFTISGENAYVGGNFTNIGGQTRNHLAQINLASGMVTDWNPDADGNVAAIQVVDDQIFVAGAFTSIGGQSRQYLTSLNTDGSVGSVYPKPNGAVTKIAKGANALGVIGNFGFMNSEVRNNLMAISKKTGMITDWNPDPNSIVYAIELNGNTAYIGGNFSTVGGLERRSFAEVNLSDGAVTDLTLNLDSDILSIEIYNNTLYLGGNFTSISGQNRNYLASVNMADGTLNDWNPDLNATLFSMEIFDSIMYLSGNFTTVGSIPRNFNASFNLNSGNMTDWDPAMNGVAFDFEVTKSTLYAAGNFNSVAGHERNGLAAFNRKTGVLKGWKVDLGVNTMPWAVLRKGKNIFLGGSIQNIGGITTNNFAMVNGNTGFPELYFPDFEGEIYNFAASDDMLYVGGNFTTVNGFNYGGLATFTFPQSYFAAEVDDIKPKTGGNIGNVTVTVTGNGFIDGTIVKLSKNGQPDIILEDAVITDEIRVTGSLNLNEVETGDWNVVVYIPGDTTLTITNGFNVETGIEPQLYTSIVGGTAIRRGVWQPYTLVYGNSGNIDAVGVPVWFTVSEEAQIEFNFTTLRNYEYLGVPYDPAYDSLSPIFVADTVMSFPGRVKVVGLYLPVVPANSVNSLVFKLKMDNPGQMILMSWIDEPYFNEEDEVKSAENEVSIAQISSVPAECYWVIMKESLLEIPQIGCLYSTLKASYGLGTAVYQLIDPDLFNGQTTSAFTMIDLTANMIIDCTPAGALKSFSKATHTLLGLIKSGNDAVLIDDLRRSCKRPRKPPQPLPPIPTINSSDPNDKNGPIGFGDMHYINKTEAMPYIIRCENVDTATAAAQTVIILDTLDRSVFDLSTFQLGYVMIGDTLVPIPSGLRSFETDIDLRPANNMIARVKAELDMETGVASWIFSSIDPSTFELSTDPFGGVLLPNINKPEGEASVMYSINTLENIADGTEIKNKAYIYFDANEPIITNEWVNKRDITKPSSSVASLPQTQHNDSTIVLRWSGTDTGSGINNYDIYYSIDGSEFQLLVQNIADTTYNFIGNTGKEYAFFSISSDNVGNIEDMKSSAEAHTYLTVGKREDIAFNENDISVYPNPNSGNFDLQIRMANPGNVNIMISDIYGRVIDNIKLSLTSGINTIPLKVTDPGLYFITVMDNDVKIVRKTYVIK